MTPILTGSCCGQEMTGQPKTQSQITRKKLKFRKQKAEMPEPRAEDRVAGLCHSTGFWAGGIELVMLPGRRFTLTLLAIMATAVACSLIAQSAAMNRQRKQAAELQQRLSTQMARHELLRQQFQTMQEELDCMEHSRRNHRNEGDHWLPGELDRLRHDRPQPAGG